jgi:hypothetical protein
MGVMKRIATRRICDPALHGSDPESAAMRRILSSQSREDECVVRVVSEADKQHQGELPF